MTERLDDQQRADKPSDPMATPLTDEEVETAKKFSLTSHGLWVSAEFARDLERQLTDAKQRINEWRDLLEKAERPTARSAGGPIIQSVAEAEAARATRSARTFSPTHVHIDGGYYRLIERTSYKTSLSEWSDAIIYEDKDGKLWVTTPARWSDRFASLENATDATTDRNIDRG